MHGDRPFPANRSRRRVLLGGALLLGSAAGLVRRGHAAQAGGARNPHVEYGQTTLPAGIRSRRIDTNNGVVQHVLEAGFETAPRPCVVLLHGFPELAFTWRKQLLPLARAGFHVVAPDARGYGLSVSRPVAYDDELAPYTLLNRVSDVVGLVRALGRTEVAAVVGHDWGSPTAAWCALVRPDVFRSVALMSTPFSGTPELPLGSADNPPPPAPTSDLDAELAALPRPRKHYISYCATRGANEDLWHPPQGVHDLLRALYHMKSADWPGNKPYRLKSRTATELAQLPTYYVMDRGSTFAETFAEAMPTPAEIAACRWLTEPEMKVYSSEFERTGFQGGLNYYRIDAGDGELRAFSGRTIDVPACFLAGAREWGPYQRPGALEAMQQGLCTRYMGTHFIEGAGHSLAEEQPEAVNRVLLDFLAPSTA